jgi:hypothetical protein
MYVTFFIEETIVNSHLLGCRLSPVARTDIINSVLDSHCQCVETVCVPLKGLFRDTEVHFCAVIPFVIIHMETVSHHRSSVGTLSLYKEKPKCYFRVTVCVLQLSNGVNQN